MTQHLLKDLLDYSQETGMFAWKVRVANCIQIGDIAGCDDGNGYTIIRIRNRLYRAHRLAWLYFYGEWPKQEIDHINGSRSDNRISNLREADRSDNTSNRKTLRNGLKGVSFFKRDKKWMAQISKYGKRIYLGMFDTEQEAHDAYMCSAKQIHGEFARAA